MAELSDDKKKVDALQKYQRIRQVMEWILEDYTSTDIVQQIIAKWGLSERHAKRYVSEARKNWINQESILLEHKRKLKLETLKKLKRSLKAEYAGTPKGIRAILAVEKEIIALEGYAKLKIEDDDGEIDLNELPIVFE